MSLTNTVNTALYSATYNPEAEKALASQQEKNEKSKRSLQEQMDKIKAYRITFGEISSDANKKLDTLLASAQTILNITTSSQKDYMAQQTIVYTGANSIFKQQESYKALSTFITLFPDQIKIWVADKRIDDVKEKEFTVYLKEKIVPFFKDANNKSSDELQAKIYVIKQDLLGITQGTKLEKNDIKIELKKSEIDAKLKEQETVANSTFNTSKLASDVWDTTTQVVSTLLYITLCLVAGMLVANDAIGRETKYRVLYFIYGCIFCPFVLLYYVGRFVSGTSPKIYTLLPITTMIGETTLGSFFLFPFSFQEDDKTKQKQVEFLSECAKRVGKTFDASMLVSNINTNTLNDIITLKDKTESVATRLKALQ